IHVEAKGSLLLKVSTDLDLQGGGLSGADLFAHREHGADIKSQTVAVFIAVMDKDRRRNRDTLNHKFGPAASAGRGRTKFVVEGVTVTPSVLIHDRYEDGYGLGLDVSAVFSVSKKVGSGQTTSLKIEVSAYFEQQGAFGLNVD